MNQIGFHADPQPISIDERLQRSKAKADEIQCISGLIDAEHDRALAWCRRVDDAKDRKDHK